MQFKYNNPAFKNKRRKLRQNQTDAEQKIWNKLRARKLNGLKFFRQYSLGKFIVDFYCPKLKLAIEIDGGQHSENIAYDEERTQLLTSQHQVVVLRFWNNEVMENIDGVIEAIQNTADTLQ